MKSTERVLIFKLRKETNQPRLYFLNKYLFLKY